MKGSEQRLITSLGSLALIAGALYIYASWISPEFNEIQKMRGEKQALNNVLSDYEAIMQKKISVIARYRDLTGVQEVFSKVMPATQEKPSFLNQLYGLASLNGVLISAIDFSELPLQIRAGDSLVRPYGTIQATIRGNSTYDNLKKYLGALQANVRIMNITAVNITDGFKDSPMLSYTITVETYYLAQ